MSKITKVKGRQILDSRGNPTVEVDIYSDNIMGRAAVPSGASTGENEAVELRDGGKEYLGKAVTKAVNNINTTISSELLGKSFNNQKEIDNLLIDLDGSHNKSNLGANAILGVSLAYAHLLSNLNGIPLYKHLGGDKANLFPNSVFIIGADTFTRMLDEKFYLNRKDMLDQLDLFNSHNINFLVFGRKINKTFISLDSVQIPEHIKNRFTGFGEEIFRDDISSSIIRKVDKCLIP